MKSVSTATSTGAEPVGTLVNAFGGRYYRITHADRLPSFFMNVVSSSDLWLFLASNGGVTAGRVDAENALFPYQTVDRVYDSAGINGPVTAFWVEAGAGPVLWEPFARRTAAHAGVIRNLYKSVEGDRVWFEEINPVVGLAFRYGWSTSELHGFVRRCELENLTDQPKSVRVLDGLRNVLPAGIPLRLQNGSSCLTDAYKTAELLPGTSLVVYALAAAIVDRAIPLESLRASIVCSEGLPGAVTLLSDQQLGKFYEGGLPAPESQCRGIRTSYFLTATLALEPCGLHRWMMVADIGLSQSDITSRRQDITNGTFGTSVVTAADESTQRLRRLVGAADGLQAGAEETTTVHHFANVLFNVMRGGIYLSGHNIPGRDFAAFVSIRNHTVAERYAPLLASLPVAMTRSDFIACLAASADCDLERLGFEYLPLTFSRRHGDPSRPWNRFSIRVRDAEGNPLLSHEGNWRDIFQNWEALCLSHPEFFESIVAKFVNASTRDGYNPYRVTHAGIDWELPDHEDPWSSIGYWGDHQVIYLQKLLEWSGHFHPGRLESWLRRDLFSYANVPYRIAGYPAMRRDPHVTIEFDDAQNRAIADLCQQQGSDARLVQRAGGGVLHVNLTEKLLVVVLTRLTNFVPGGGIWMNTQRPEWNDANNALVGYGVSMVTLSYLRRMLVHLQRVLLPALGTAPVAVSSSVAGLLRGVQAAYDVHRALLDAPVISSPARRALLDALAAAGTDYRTQIYHTGLGAPSDLSPMEITRLLGTALAFVDHTLRANRRDDGLYHSYNLLEFTEEPAGLRLHHLGPMLEGQVAVLSSGLLTPPEVIDLLTALRRSALYRADQHSYLLYPDRQLPGFLERNVIPADAVASCPLLPALCAAGDARLVVHDADGQHRFAPDLANGSALNERLAELAADPHWAVRVQIHAPQVCAIYENVFKHRAFTGRSGSMFGYEGLGCIYWHMVAKLLLSIQENLVAAEAAADPLAACLAALYYDVRAGLGFNKTPAEYGAFPTDPYSHTPGHSGAQQPGMTGQVKEEILTRLGELGVRIAHGCVSFAPTLLPAVEFFSAREKFTYIDHTGQEAALELSAGSLGFTFCSTPVVYRLSQGPALIRIHLSDGTTQEQAGRQLDAATGARLFARDGRIHHLEVQLGTDFRAYRAPAARFSPEQLGSVTGSFKGS
jgi:hypothetical protein